MRKPILVFLLLLQSSYLFAQNTLSYSGRLVNSTGVPVTGTVNLKIDLAYTDTLNSNPPINVCTKPAFPVTLSNGVFHVALSYTSAQCGGKTLSEIMQDIPNGETLVYQVTDTTNSKAYGYQAVHAIPSSVIAQTVKTLPKLGATTSGQILTWDGSKWGAAAAPVSSGGTLTDLQAGTGITVSSIDADTYAVGISNAGVDTNQLANGAVTDAKVATGISRAKLAAGTPSHVLVNDGTTGLMSSISLSTLFSSLGLGTAAVANVGTSAGDVLPSGGITACLPTQKLQFTGSGPTWWSCIAEDGADPTKLPLAGGSMSGALAMGSNKITGLAAPTADADAATKKYVDDSVSSGVQWTVSGSNIYRPTGSVGVGVAPTTKLEVAGTIRIGDGGEVCAAGIAGGIRYSGASIQYCNGTSWASLGVAGAGITALTGDVTASGNGSVAATIAASAVDSGKIADGTIATADVADSAVTLAKIQNIATNRILGRSTTGPGVVEQITVGTGLNLAAGTLSVTFPTDNDSLMSLGCSTNQMPFHNGTAWTCKSAVNTNTASAVVVRDASGDFAAADASLASVFLRNGSFTAKVQAPTLAANYVLTLPVDDGTANQVLTTDGNGVLSWSSASAPGITTLTGDVTAAGPGSAAATIAVDAVTTAKILDGTIATSDIAPDAITSSKVLDGTLATADLANDSVTFAKLQNLNTNKLLGRATALSGDAEEITLGTGLSYTGTTLNVTFPTPPDQLAALGCTTSQVPFFNGTTWGCKSAVDTNTNSAIIARDASGNFLAGDANLGGVGFRGGGFNIIMRAPSLVGNFNLTLPPNTGTANQVLTTDGTGVMTWTTPASAGITALTGDVTATGPGSVTGTIANSAVTSAKILDGTVANADLAADSVATGNLVDGTVATADLANNAVSFAKFQNVSSQILLGRSTAMAGAVEEITLGSGLTLALGVLNVTDTVDNDALMSLGCTTNQFPLHNGTAWTCSTISGGGDFFKDGSVAMTGQFKAANGTAAAPSVAFANSLGTGLYRPAANEIGISINGSEKVRVDANGNIGIGATAPASKLVVNGSSLPAATAKMSISGTPNNTDDDVILNLSRPFNAGIAQEGRASFSLTHFGDTFPRSQLNINLDDTGVMLPVMSLRSSGFVGIGTTTPGAALDVKGAIHLSGSSSGYSGFQAAAAAGSTVWTLPSADGSSGQVLSTNGSGVLSWSNSAASSVTSLTGDVTGTGPGATATTISANAVTSAKILDGTIATADVADSAITFGKIQNMSTNKLLGRSTAAAGAVEEISLGTGLTLSGGTLNTSAPSLSATAPVAYNSTTGVISLGVVPIANGGTGLTSTTAGTVVTTDVATGAYEFTTCPNDSLLQFDTILGFKCATFPTGAGDFFKDGSVAMTGQFKASNGTAAAPSIAFANSLGTGFYRPAADQIGVSTNGSEKLRIDANGNLGIGTSSPTANLSITRASSGIGLNLDAGSGNYFDINSADGLRIISGGNYNTGPSFQMWPTGSGYQGIFFDAGSATGADINFRSAPGGGSGGMVVKQGNGRVGINQSNPGSELDVKGVIRISGATTGYAGFQSAANAGSTIWTLPMADGSSGQVLQTNGSGVLSWSTPAAAGEPVIAAGATTQYYRGDKSWQTLDTSVVPEGTNLYYTNARTIASTLTGYTTGTNVAVAATDTIMTAIGKVEAKATAALNGAWTISGSDVYRSSGTVGIGTTPSGSYKLEVNGLTKTGGVYSTGGLQVAANGGSAAYSPTAHPGLGAGLQLGEDSTSDGNGAQITMIPRNSSANYQRAFIGAFSNPGAGVYTPTMFFMQQTGASTYAERMRIDQNGNLGIGTTSPTVAVDIGSKTDAILVPRGTTAQRPSAPVNGMMRYNTSTNKMEFYAAGTWNNVIYTSGQTVPEGTGGTGYFVITNTSYTGNLGGLTGANTICRNHLTANNWKNKPGSLDTSKIFAFLCDSGGCQTPMPNANFYYAVSGDDGVGGAVFATDSDGSGPGINGSRDYNPLNYNDRFGGHATGYWTGHRNWSDGGWNPANTNYSSSAVCDGWTSSSNSVGGGYGTGTDSQWARYSSFGNTHACDTMKKLICYVNP